MDAPTFALVAGAEDIPRDELMRVARAIELQIHHDLTPLWGVTAAVVAVPYGDQPTSGAWPVIVLAELDQPGALAYHFVDGDVPTARVQHTDGWPLAASHQVLEMLVAPDNERFVHTPSPKTGEGRVEILVQVCDPCGMASAYEIDGVPVANFVLPAYYEAGSHGPFDHLGQIKHPLEVLEGGYVSWRDPATLEFFQMYGPDGSVRSFGAETSSAALTGALAGAGNDAVADRDQLGFEAYAQAFADLIASPDTSPPLTIGIYGSWGVGKSFLLRHIERRLGDRPRTPGAPTVHVVQFNAWEYSAAAAVWPALVRRIMGCLDHEVHWPFPGRFLRKLWRNAIWELHQERARLLGALLGAALLLALLLTVNGLQVTALWAAAVAVGAGGVLKVVADTLASPVSRWMSTLLSDGSYGAELGPMRRIHDDLEWLGERLKDENGRFVVMIDDLDRCEPDKAVEVLQAINLLLNFDSFIVCLGIDARIITRAVERHYRGLLGPAGASGYEYLDKIVQIPFRIPRPSPEDVVGFLGEQMPSAEEAQVPASVPTGQGQGGAADAQAATTVAAAPGVPVPPPVAPARQLTAWGPDERRAFQRLAPFLRPNPRHLKRMVNVYRLVRALALLRRENAILDDPLPTIKLLALCAQWPYALAAMLDRLDEKVMADEDWPEGDPLQILYHEVEPRLDPAVRARLDDDQDDLEGLLLYPATLEPDALAAVRAYTVNFNPAVESELRRARLPVVEEVATNGAADQAGRNRTAVP
jgi:KAP family P-loop domain